MQAQPSPAQISIILPISREILLQISLDCVRKIIKFQLKLKFDRFFIVELSNLNFNLILMTFRTQPKTL
jgi:hypothetical protein